VQKVSKKRHKLLLFSTIGLGKIGLKEIAGRSEYKGENWAEGNVALEAEGHGGGGAGRGLERELPQEVPAATLLRPGQ